MYASESKIQHSSRLLVVEDEETLRFALIDLLIDAGYEVTAGRCGTDIVAILKKDSQFDLILSDLKMPEMDGIELLRFTKQHYPDIAYVLLTSHADVQTAVQAMRDGAFNYLLKPIERELLLKTVEEALTQGNKPLKREITAIDAHDRFLRVGELVVDRYHLNILFRNVSLDLTPTEYEILYHLVKAHGRVVTFEDIVLATQGMKVERSEARVMLSTHLSNLRSKLGKVGCDHYLVNKRGTGYFVSADE
jgi:DNA-binding response OmpR family regulator